MSDKLIDDIQTNIIREQEFLATYRADADARALTAQLFALEPTYCYQDVYLAEISLSFTGDGTRFSTIWRILRQAGWELEAGYDRPKAGEPSWGGRFKHERATISIWLHLCRRRAASRVGRRSAL